MAPDLWSLGKVQWHESHPVTFDSSIWRDAEDENHLNCTYIRLRMASYLVKNDILINKKESEIISLLGEPQNHGAISGSAYWLSPLGLDSMWLQIVYQNGKLKEYAIIND